VLFNSFTFLWEALTGNFGYGGGLVLLKRLAERQALRHVVLFYSIDAMALGPSYSGYFFTSPQPFATELCWRDKLQLLAVYAARCCSTGNPSCACCVQ